MTRSNTQLNIKHNRFDGNVRHTYVEELEYYFNCLFSII